MRSRHATPLVLIAAIAGALAFFPAVPPMPWVLSARSRAARRPRRSGRSSSWAAERVPGRPLRRRAAAARPCARCAGRPRSSARTPSRSARTARTSTSPRRGATRSRSSSATPSTGTLTQRSGAAGCIAAKGAGGCATARRARRPQLGRRQRRRRQRLRDLRSAATRSPIFSRNPSTGRAHPGHRRQRLHRQRGDRRLHHRPRARRPRRRHRQPRRRQRLRRRVLRQRGRRRSPATRRPARSRSPPTPPAASSTRRPTAAPPASRWRLRRAWRSAPTATTSTSPRRSATPSRVFTRDPSTGALTQATDGSGCIVNAALDRLHDRHRSSAAPTRWRSAPTTTTST